MTQTVDTPAGSTGAACPHCHKLFEPSMDLSQPLRLQGAKCPHCKLFVPVRLLPKVLSAPPAKAARGRLTKTAPKAPKRPARKR